MIPLGRELGVPMRMCNLALAEMTEALNRGWEGRDSGSVMLLQQAAVSAEAARQRCGNATLPACFPWAIGALFDRPKLEEPNEFCRVFGPWTAGAGTSFFIVA